MKTLYQVDRHPILKAFALLVMLFANFNCYASGHALDGLYAGIGICIEASLASILLAFIFAVTYTFWINSFLKVLTWLFSITGVLLELIWAPVLGKAAGVFQLILILPIIAAFCIYLVQRKRTE